MESDLNSRIDRYLNRELDPPAARALAHEALDDSNLFDELTAVALVQAALESPATTDRALAQAALDDEDLFETLIARGAVESSFEDPAFRSALPTSERSKRWPMVIAAAVAIAAGLVTFVILRPSPQPVRQAAPQARTTVAKPIPASAILLNSDLQPEKSHDAPIFRGADAASRAPKSDGTIVSIQDGVATVNLGSLDGLSKGTELSVVRDRQKGQIVVTTVFRDRARGKVVAGGAIQVGDAVSVPSSAHIGAILQQVDALAAGGNLKAARDLAQKTLANGAPGETRALLERLAALDYQSGAPEAARERYEVAVNNFAQPPAASVTEQASALASYGALSLLGGDRDRADDLLQKALAKAADPGLRSQILNNLGTLAEARGNPDQAAAYYNQALTQTTSKSDRAVVAANLARVHSATRP
ncbi:MAG: hypothetical protein ABSG13_21965 [Bryobacteraceae bacterium]|jgi:hypothetical protein